jgi:hypothetical protein
LNAIHLSFVSHSSYLYQSVNMRVFTRLLATATDAGASRPFKPAPAALLPPIPLYRRLLRSHRKRLGVEERVLGDMYVKAEFRAHRDVDNPVQIVSQRTFASIVTLSNIHRLASCQNGRNTAKCSKVTPGKKKKWTKGRLTR